MPKTLKADIPRLFATRIVRLFCYGFLSVVLALYLAQAGLGERTNRAALHADPGRRCRRSRSG